MKIYLVFAVLGVVWGSNFIYMKMASEHITPMQIVFLRVFAGFFPVCVYAWSKRALKAAHCRHLPHFIVMALLATTIYYYGFAVAASLLYSGVAGALSASIPIFSFVLAIIFLHEERLSANRVIGILIACGGVVLLARPFAGGDIADTNINGVLYMMLGSLSIGASFVYARKFVIPLKIPALALVTYQLGLAVLMLLLLISFDGITAIRHDAHAAVGAVVGLGVLGTGLAYIMYYYIVAQLGAVAASSTTYLPSLVALFIGAVFAGEPIGLLECAATAMIIAGVVLINKGRSKRRRRADKNRINSG